MNLPIDSAGSIGLMPPHLTWDGSTVEGAGTAASHTFAEALGDAIQAHSARAAHASELAESFAAGATEDIHGTMIAAKEVEIELHVIANVRRKVLDAFGELWRMNV